MKLRMTRRSLIGIVMICLLLPSTVFAWTAYEKNIKVRFAQIKLNVNYETIETKAEPFIYNGSVYAPVATIANALDLKWEWINHIPVVSIFDREYQLMQENYVSGHIQVNPLGNDYYYYMEEGIPGIWKGFKFQDDDSVSVKMPEPYENGPFGMAIEEFIDFDQDGMKQELVLKYELFDVERDKLEGYKLDFVKLKGEDQLVSIDTIQIDMMDIPFYNTFIFDEDSKQFEIKYYSTDESEKLLKMKVYEWQGDQIEMVAELKNIDE